MSAEGGAASRRQEGATETTETGAHLGSAAEAQSDRTVAMGAATASEPQLSHTATATIGGKVGGAKPDVVGEAGGARDRDVGNGAELNDGDASEWWAGKRMPTSRRVICSRPHTRRLSLVHGLRFAGTRTLIFARTHTHTQTPGISEGAQQLMRGMQEFEIYCNIHLPPFPATCTHRQPHHARSSSVQP